MVVNSTFSAVRLGEFVRTARNGSFTHNFSRKNNNKIS